MEGIILQNSIKKTKLVFRVFHIFLCDDDVDYLAEIKDRVNSFIKKRNIAAKLYTFTSMEKISDQLLKTCDIAILDIDFTGKQYSGIDIARRLRTFRNDSVIIFATNFIEYAPEGYEVQAFRYIMKHDIPEKLEGYLEQSIKRLHTDSDTIKFQINGEIVDLPLAQILYIEAQLHTVKVFVQTKNRSQVREYSFYGSIGKLEQHLSEKGFLRVHKSYLVNSAHVKRYQFQSVELNYGIVLKASARRYADQKAKYLFWKGQVFNE